MDKVTDPAIKVTDKTTDSIDEVTFDKDFFDLANMPVHLVNQKQYADPLYYTNVDDIYFQRTAQLTRRCIETMRQKPDRHLKDVFWPILDNYMRFTDDDENPLLGRAVDISVRGLLVTFADNAHKEEWAQMFDLFAELSAEPRWNRLGYQLMDFFASRADLDVIRRNGNDTTALQLQKIKVLELAAVTAIRRGSASLETIRGSIEQRTSSSLLEKIFADAALCNIAIEEIARRREDEGEVFIEDDLPPKLRHHLDGRASVEDTAIFVSHENGNRKTYVKAADDLLTMVEPDGTVGGYTLLKKPLGDRRNITEMDIRAESDNDSSLEPLTKYLHEPHNLALISRELGADITTLTFEQQRWLFSLMTTGDIHVFERLKSVSKRAPTDKRSSILRSFVGLQYGSDLGKTILDVAEVLDASEATELFETLEEIRLHVDAVAEFFDGYDGHFAQSLVHAFNLRTTELLAVANIVARNGEQDAVIRGTRRQYHQHIGSYELWEGLHTLRTDLDTIASCLGGGEVAELYDEDEGNLTAFSVSLPQESKHITVQIRAIGEIRKKKRLDLEYDSEARINILVGNALTDGPPSPYRSDESRHISTSYRLDKDSSAPGQNRRNPARDNCTLALDFGGFSNRLDAINTRLAMLIAYGNQLRSETTGNKPQLWHVTEVFDPYYGTIDGFATVARYVRDTLKERAHSDVAHARSKVIGSTAVTKLQEHS